MTETVQTFRYIERAGMCGNPAARELFAIMEEKNSNLAVAIDVATKEELLEIAEEVSPYACIIKTHIDIIENFDIDLLVKLQEMAKRRRILIFEDRKFADIGKTVERQYEGGIYKISQWAHLVNAHALPGPGIISGLKKWGLDRGRGLLLLAEMSSAGSLATGGYTDAVVEMARSNREFVVGFICRKKLVDEPYFIHLTPGVSLEEGEGSLGQQYRTPEEVISENGSDVIIVGSGITKAADPASAAKKYRDAGWQAYLKRVAP